eukprot:433481_1
MRRSVSQSVIKNVNLCTMSGLFLCLWFMCVIIFVSRNRKEISNSNIDFVHPFATNNIPEEQLLSNVINSEPLSYAHAELTVNGWKSIYLHIKCTRMSVEQMDYLLEKYWYPHIEEDIIEHDTVDNLEQLKQSRILIDKQADKQADKLRNAPSTSVEDKSNSGLTYPLEWSSNCFPNDIHSIKCIYNHMKYWNKGIIAHMHMHSNDVKKSKDKYVTFLKDCGGFNNIRQAFEFHVMIAWLTNRTLVIPPDMAWYLIDFGQITRGRSHQTESELQLYKSWPDNKFRRYGVSNYDIWFDLDHISLAIPVITCVEFIRREFDSLQIPMEYHGDIVNLDNVKAKSYQEWLNDKATELNVNLAWGQLANILYWPSIKDVESKNSEQIDAQWVDNRKKKEYSSFLKAAKFIHFPSCAKGVPGADHDYRYLGQIARAVAFDSRKKDREFKRILRDHIHLNGEIMEYAALVVNILGAFNYASFHIRRNELQYKYVFAQANASFHNVQPLIGDNEVLYIATDESDENYFKVFEENGKRKVYRWKDFFGDNAQFEQTKNVKIPSKLHGEVEMAICAMARIFFGTKESTFTSYIGRLRGYFGAPYTQILYHHYKLNENIDESSRISKSKPSKPYAGQIYKIPFKDLWEDINEL